MICSIRLAVIAVVEDAKQIKHSAAITIGSRHCVCPQKETFAALSGGAASPNLENKHKYENISLLAKVLFAAKSPSI